MPTRQIGSWEGGLVTAELDYNNQDQITAVRVINNSGVAVYLEVEQISNGRKVGQVFLAGTNTNIAVPTGVGQRIVQFFNVETNKWDGLNIRAQVPAP